MDDSGDTRDATSTGGTHPIGSAQTLPAKPRANVARARVGRYRIIKRLGAGGMGEVWQATDPELGREVAIKVLHDRSTHRSAVLRGPAEPDLAVELQPQLAERLRREAQALAKLDHPNVVTVHDVGLDDNGELYIVMQLVAGTTLDRAIEGKVPREIVALLAQAGRGLAAAHAAGIVHRDFKPGNVLVDKTGHVRVSDFGLARASDASDEAGDTDGSALALSMTRGELVGTPAYMAPEQLRGGPVTHATDQFAFCVTLWEALSGARPFAGKDVAALRDAVMKGPPKEPPPSIPRRLRGLLARGLQTSPEARYPSMVALLDDLMPNQRLLWVAGGVGVAALATTTILLGVTRPAEADPCRGVEQPIDAVWGDPQRAAVRAALGGVAPSAIAVLDDRTARWRAMRLEACQASHVKSEPQSLDERDQRYACLDQALIDQRAAVALLAGRPDARLVGRATLVASAGRDPVECTRKAAAARLATGKATPLDPALQIELAAAVALREAGHFTEFLARRDTLEPRIVASGDHETMASWFFGVYYAIEQHDDPLKSREPLRRAVEAALAARRDDIAARTWGELAVLTARASDLEAAEDLLMSARGAAARSDRPIVKVWIALAEGHVLSERGKFAEAIAKCNEALATARALGHEQDYMIEATGCVFDSQHHGGDLEGALATSRMRLARSVEFWGPSSQAELEIRRGLASVYAGLGKTAEARAEWQLALAGFEKHFGSDSLEVMWTLRDFANAQTPAGTSTTPEAVAAIRRAVTIAEARLPPAHPQRASVYEVEAYVLGAQGKLDESTAAYDKAIAVYEKHDDPMALARALYNSADALKESGKCDRALPRFARAAKVAASTGQASTFEANALYARGTCLGEAKQWAEADAALRLAIEQLDKLDDDAYLFAAQARWELAEQLVKRGKREESLVIAKAALAQLAGKPPPAEAFSAEIAKWIKQQ